MEIKMHILIVATFIVSFLAAALCQWQISVIHWLVVCVSGLASILSLAILVIERKNKSN
ncbi:MAG: hypothetical protein RRY12_00790 [Cloacibacillus sp.]